MSGRLAHALRSVPIQSEAFESMRAGCSCLPGRAHVIAALQHDENRCAPGRYSVHGTGSPARAASGQLLPGAAGGGNSSQRLLAFPCTGARINTGTRNGVPAAAQCAVRGFQGRRGSLAECIMVHGELRILVAALAVFAALAGLALAIHGLLFDEHIYVDYGMAIVAGGIAAFVVMLTVHPRDVEIEHHQHRES
jgi:hypothetical protein